MFSATCRCLPLSCVFFSLVTASLTLRAAETGKQPASPPADAATIWCTADRLMPAWGFYRNAQAYGDTKPLGRWAGWTVGGLNRRLTWVADFPRDSRYQVWVRRYAGYGTVAVAVDERPVTGGRGGGGGGRYVWAHLGATSATAGRHHVDITVSHGMFDAVLLTADATCDPSRDSLPPAVEKPVRSALRTYRDDSPLRPAAGPAGFVVGQPATDEEVLYDWLPAAEQLGQPLRLWGAAGQYLNGSVVVRALEEIGELRASVGPLTGPGGVVVKEADIDLRVVLVRERLTDLYEQGGKLLVPEILLRDDRTGLPPKGRQGGFGGGACVTRIPAHHSRQLWLTVHMPASAPPGRYSGQLALERSKGAGVVFGHRVSKMDSGPAESDSRPRPATHTQRIPVEIELLPIPLRPAAGYYSIYYPSQPIDSKRPNYVSRRRYLAELQDHVRHGLNAATLYGGYATLPLAHEAGMTRAPCVMNWPDSDAPQQVRRARELGFDDLYYYGVDEPNQPAAIDRCRREAQRRLNAGLHMMTAVNSRPAQEATKDVVDRPVYNIYVFGGPDNPAVRDVLDRGFQPISYWTTATTWPLWFRALAGLYNRRCGYLGCAPWAYQDYPDARLWDPDAMIHRVSYPDEFGEPIPTLCWEAHRAGIDDVRYLEALDRALAEAERRLKAQPVPAGLAERLAAARATRRRCFDAIQGRWFEYLCRLPDGELDRTRRALADATVSISR